MTDQEIIESIKSAVDQLNLLIIEAAESGISVDLATLDITEMRHKVRALNYQPTITKVLYGFLK